MTEQDKSVMGGQSHTPGPWVVPTVPYPHVRGPYGCILARDYEPTPEDARLIAAAPELLDALRRSEDGWSNAIDLGIIPPQHVLSATILRDEARAAIAKATGTDQ